MSIATADVQDDIFSLDYGGARSVWRELVDLMQQGVAFTHFRVCEHCTALFYAHRKDQMYCRADPCQGARNNRNQEKSRECKRKD